MSAFVDPLGFTKQTEILLCGVGAQNLIQEFKKRNISTDALHKLTKEDLEKLGANENQAESMVKVLRISRKKNESIEAKPYRISDKVNILKTGEKQLDVIKAFLTYSKLRLREERINSFVEIDKALSSSQVLCIVADALLKEINEAELKLKELQAVIIMPRSNQRYSYILYYIPVGGLCIATCMLLIRFWR
ncbi:uncharacterized protein [Linepithema humile]|uniref:uncharacterized protein isoform X1 n=1 Tax=Linepithema humile TaxID=83485 RepID=UPI00351E3842